MVDIIVPVLSLCLSLSFSPHPPCKDLITWPDKSDSSRTASLKTPYYSLPAFNYTVVMLEVNHPPHKAASEALLIRQ